MTPTSQRHAEASARFEPEKVSEELDRWLRARGDMSLGSLIDLLALVVGATGFVLAVVLGGAAIDGLGKLL